MFLTWKVFQFATVGSLESLSRAGSTYHVGALIDLATIALAGRLIYSGFRLRNV